MYVVLFYTLFQFAGSMIWLSAQIMHALLVSPGCILQVSAIVSIVLCTVSTVQ